MRRRQRATTGFLPRVGETVQEDGRTYFVVDVVHTYEDGEPARPPRLVLEERR